MGMFSTLLSKAKTFDGVISDGAIGLVAQQLTNYSELQNDPALPAAFAATDEVQEIENVTADDGTYTLTFVLADGTTFTTAALDHDANAAAIEAAIDLVSGLEAGAISVSGGPIDTAPIVLTYDGAEVAGLNHGEVTVANSLTNGGPAADDPAVSTTTEGQTDREVWAVLAALDVITDDAPPVQGLATPVVTAGSNLLNVKPWLIRALAKEAAEQDQNPDVESMINVAVLGQNRG